MVVLVRVTVLVLLEVDAAIRTLISVMVVLVRVTVLVLLEVDAASPPLEDVLEDVVVDEPPPDAPDVVVDQPSESPPPPEDVDVDQPDDDALKLAQGSSGSLLAAAALPGTAARPRRKRTANGRRAPRGAISANPVPAVAAPAVAGRRQRVVSGLTRAVAQKGELGE